VRALALGQANEHDPAQLRATIEAIVDDLLHFASELWIVIDMLDSDDPPD
jgi:hypothetical protein